MSTIVNMHFGDGNYVPLEMESDDPETAIAEARTYVTDNAFFRVERQDGDCAVLAEESL